MKHSKYRIAEIIFKHIKGNINSHEASILHEWREDNIKNDNLFNNLILKKNFENKHEVYNLFLKQNRIELILKEIASRKRVKLYHIITIAASFILPLCIIAYLFSNKFIPSDIQKQSTQISQELRSGSQKAILINSDGSELMLDKEDFKINKKSGVKISNIKNSLEYTASKKVTNKLVFNTVIVPRGGEFYVKLSDGTKVWINSESKIRFPEVFANNQRDVYVEGEIFFSVVHDVKRPFVVHYNNTHVKVLGTEFNVRSYDKEPLSHTTLVNGKVEVKIDGNNKTIQLSPNQQYEYNKQTQCSEVKVVNTEYYTSWKDGEFIFNKQRLDDILNILSRWYNVEIVFEDNSLKDVMFSGRLKRSENAETLFNIFSQMEDVNFRIQKNIIYVNKN